MLRPTHSFYVLGEAHADDQGRPGNFTRRDEDRWSYESKLEHLRGHAADDNAQCEPGV